MAAESSRPANRVRLRASEASVRTASLHPAPVRASCALNQWAIDRCDRLIFGSTCSTCGNRGAFLGFDVVTSVFGWINGACRVIEAARLRHRLDDARLGAPDASIIFEFDRRYLFE
jgi:hypothetical protein